MVRIAFAINDIEHDVAHFHLDAWVIDQSVEQVIAVLEVHALGRNALTMEEDKLLTVFGWVIHAKELNLFAPLAQVSSDVHVERHLEVFLFVHRQHHVVHRVTQHSPGVFSAQSFAEAVEDVVGVLVQQRGVDASL